MNGRSPRNAGTGPLVRARGLVKSFGPVTAVRGVDVDLAAGRIVAVIGPNGAGKTTLVSMLAGLVAPDAGTVEVCGVDAGRRPVEARARIGLAPQETGVYPTLTVRENVAYFGRLHGLRGAGLDARVDWILDAVGLGHLAGATAAGLSGGQRRRVHTAIALVGRPPVLLLDEPTVGADIDTRTRLLDLVRTLAADGAAVGYTTHYLPEVEALGADVVMLHRGAVVARGTVPELLAGTGGRVEVRFDGPAPDRAADGFAVVDPTTLAVACADPAAAVPAVLATLGPDAGRVRGIEIVRPSLEAVFRRLTDERPGAFVEAD